MSTDSWITLAVLVGLVVVLVIDRWPPVIVLGSAVAALLFVGVIDTDIALGGLASPAPATIAALYVLAGAATATGTFAGLVDRALDRRRPIVGLTTGTALLSSVIPNTPLVAMFAPRVVRWSRRRGADSSRYLMPLSFASLLGGMVTLIGTSTNLVVSDLLEQSGQEPLGMFEFTAVGLPIAAVGVMTLSLFSGRLLPRREAVDVDVERRAREFQMIARVEPAGALVGKSIAESGLRNLDGVYLALIERGDAQHDTATALAASPETRLQANDICCFVGDVSRVIDLHDISGLTTTEAHHLLAARGAGTRVFEAVVAPASRLVGASLRSADFRSRYGGAVMAIHRADGQLGGQLGRIELRGGDVLLVLAAESFGDRWRADVDFSLVAAVDEPPPPVRTRSWLVIACTLLLLVATSTEILTLFEAALAAAVIVVAGGAITANEGLRAVNLSVVLTIAFSISLGSAVERSGLAAEISDIVVRIDALGGGDFGLVAGIMVATVVLGEVLANNAAAALMIPVALSVAADVGAEPRMLAIAVLFGASCSFLTPVGYQTNLMVFSLGGYRFGDFARVGLPLTVTTILVASTLLPVVF